MKGPEIMEIQQILDQTGYPVEATGSFDDNTRSMVKKLQMEFGLTADGIIGPRTRALIYQMSPF